MNVHYRNYPRQWRLRVIYLIFKLLSGEIQFPDTFLDGQRTIMGLFIYV
jgi:hypothetical protein